MWDPFLFREDAIFQGLPLQVEFHDCAEQFDEGFGGNYHLPVDMAFINPIANVDSHFVER